MVRKIFKIGNSIVVSLPKDTLEFLELAEGDEVSVELDKEQRQIVVTPLKAALPGDEQVKSPVVPGFWLRPAWLWQVDTLDPLPFVKWPACQKQRSTNFASRCRPVSNAKGIPVSPPTTWLPWTNEDNFVTLT
ncbi:MAG: AbrB/MazE/SpoVT family DNA-binding domain-containing protein [Anaerolineales bacterium]|nr:MAG: AbrB/MazE/SpoVT family DNA-binding domain-containing protein [Anaerolineales bacterium]